MEGPCKWAEQFGLIDGLTSPAILKLWGAVRRKQEKGDSGVIGLRHRREPVGRGRTGGADQCGWSACPLAKPKSEEGSGSLVKNGNGPKADLVFASQDERSGAGTGREYDMIYAKFKQSFGHGVSPCAVGSCG